MIYTDLITPLALERCFLNHWELTWVCELGALLKLQCLWTQSSAEAWRTNLVGSGSQGEFS